VCDIDQYGAPSIDGSKDDQAGVPATVAVAQGPATSVTVPTGAPTATAASKGPTTPTAQALAPAARKKRPAGGWPATVRARSQQRPWRGQRGARVGYDGGRADRRVEACGGGGTHGGACKGASSYDDTECVLTGGGGGSLKDGDGRGEVG
jgi:hypothetical protein